MPTIREARSVAEVLGALPNLFLTLKLSPEASAEWAAELADIPAWLLAQAAIDVAATDDFVSPARLRKRAAALAAGERDSKTGATAYAEALAAVDKFGVYRTPQFEDARVAHCVRVIGWQTLCMQTSNEAVSNRARFIEEWDKAQGKRELAAILPPAPREAISEMAKHWLLPTNGRPAMSLRDAVKAYAPKPGAPGLPKPDGAQ